MCSVSPSSCQLTDLCVKARLGPIVDDPESDEKEPSSSGGDGDSEAGGGETGENAAAGPSGTQPVSAAPAPAAAEA